MAAGGTSTATRRLTVLKRAMTPSEWRRLGAFYAVVLLLHVVGFGIFFTLVLPQNLKGLALGTAFLAYSFGLRHAFDADHISAIDNTTRKLMGDGQRPLGVGFFFSLGHSTVVLGLSMAIAFTARLVAGAVTDPSSQLHSVGQIVGTLVSGSFLYLIAILNIVILVGIVKVFRDMRRGYFDEPTLEKKLNDRGLMNRLLGPIARSIRHSWQMYPIGLLFGLGFDTATEIGVIAISAGAATAGLPFYSVICLPLIFAAGMSLMDTADGAFMSVAYGWAFSKPVRKVYYNITITGLSIAVALIVGTVELLGVVANQWSLSGGFWGFVGRIDLNMVGFIIVGLFVLTWVVALAVWKLARIEDRWTLAPVAHRGAQAGHDYTPMHDSGDHEIVA